MQLEATTSELATLLDVSEKTICQWAKAGVMVKLRHGRYDLGRSLQNWTAYQRCVHEGFDHPLDTWAFRQEALWIEEERADPELRKRRFAEIEALDAQGRVTRARPAST